MKQQPATSGAIRLLADADYECSRRRWRAGWGPPAGSREDGAGPFV